jgi:hypothetical protein
MRNYSYIYESAQIENFERQILSGYLTEAKLIEMYENNELSEQQIAIAEGLFDRFRARGSQALGAIKGAGQQLQGKVQQAAGNVVNRAGNLAAKGVEAVGGTIDPSKNKLTQYGNNLSQQGQQNQQQGQQAGQVAKFQSYVKNSVNTIANDLQSLGMAVKDRNSFMKELTDVLTRNLVNMPNSNQSAGAVQQNPMKGKLGPAFRNNLSQTSESWRR